MSASTAAWVLAKVAHRFSVTPVLWVAEVMLKYSEIEESALNISVKLSRLLCTENQSSDLSVMEMREDISAHVNKM